MTKETAEAEPKVFSMNSAGPHRRDWAWAASTLLGTGHLRPGPGTWGSGATLALWAAAGHALPSDWQWITAALWCAAATAIGIPAATREALRSGQHDPSHIVVDEMAGQMLTVIAAPLRWKTLLTGFILFRCFDVLKPFPVRRFERLPGGTGIVLDDLAAGVYAWIVLHLLLRTGIVS
jgi:phosphatidylglycerophosphatase A